MNHYESDAVTRVKDDHAISRILALDPRGLYDAVRNKGITMCGYAATVAMLVAVREGSGARSLCDFRRCQWRSRPSGGLRRNHSSLESCRKPPEHPEPRIPTQPQARNGSEHASKYARSLDGDPDVRRLADVAAHSSHVCGVVVRSGARISAAYSAATAATAAAAPESSHTYDKCRQSEQCKPAAAAHGSAEEERVESHAGRHRANRREQARSLRVIHRHHAGQLRRRSGAIQRR